MARNKKRVLVPNIMGTAGWDVLKDIDEVDLASETWLSVGFGRLGTRAAKRCLAMEMNVLVYDPYVPADQVRAAGCEPVGDLDAALPRADFVSIHCPRTAETEGMFGTARLERMNPTGHLVNTARGGIIDAAAPVL